MVSQQRSFQIIECPAGVSSPHAYLVVSGRGVPHEALTMFYETLQTTASAATLQAILVPLLSFFSFLEQPEQQACCSNRESKQLPAEVSWAGPPSEIRAAIRAYLLTYWGCLTRRHDQQEEVVLSPTASETVEIQHFLAVLQQFYRFAIARRDYWYESNPTEAFYLPLRSRLWHALNVVFRSPATRHPSSVDEGGKEVPIQKSTPVSSREEQPVPTVPTEAWIQLVPVSEHVATIR